MAQFLFMQQHLEIYPAQPLFGSVFSPIFHKSEHTTSIQVKFSCIQRMFVPQTCGSSICFFGSFSSLIEFYFNSMDLFQKKHKSHKQINVARAEIPSIMNYLFRTFTHKYRFFPDAPIPCKFHTSFANYDCSVQCFPSMVFERYIRCVYVPNKHTVITYPYLDENAAHS